MRCIRSGKLYKHKATLKVLAFEGENNVVVCRGDEVFARSRSGDVVDYYNHAHNDYIQFMSEYGALGTFWIALFVLSSTVIAISTLIKRNNPIMQSVGFAGLMVIIALLMHSLVDFNLQIMANASSAIIILGLVWSARNMPTMSGNRSRN